VEFGQSPPGGAGCSRFDARTGGLVRSSLMANDEGGVRSIDQEEAQRLVRDGAVRVLDVRTPEEYRELGHIPGAILLPVNLVASGLATLPRDGRPLLVYCEHGIRSVAAARLLARAGGFRDLLNLQGGLAGWKGPRDFTPGEPFGPIGPSSWLVQNADLLPPGGRTLDLACGAGRHALLLAVAGFPVRAVDRDREKIEALGEMARRLEIPLQAQVLDLESPDLDLGSGACDLILGFHYLHRPLFAALVGTLSRGGLLLYETFTLDQALHGKPTNPSFLLGHGELPHLVAPLEILREREGEFEGRMVSSVAARRR
jgi:rhodanese-related sulfurtransferase